MKWFVMTCLATGLLLSFGCASAPTAGCKNLTAKFIHEESNKFDHMMVSYFCNDTFVAEMEIGVRYDTIPKGFCDENRRIFMKGKKRNKALKAALAGDKESGEVMECHPFFVMKAGLVSLDWLRQLASMNNAPRTEVVDPYQAPPQQQQEEQKDKSQKTQKADFTDPP